MDEPIRIVIVEDHPLFRKGLRVLLAGAADLDVIGEAEDGPEAIDLTNRLQPDVVLMDLHLPRMSGIGATREILAIAPRTRILVVTLFEDDDSVFAALRAGARGYMLKDAHEDEILRAVRAVAAGEAIFSPAIATRVLQFFATPRVEAPKLFPELTEREREVLTLLARGKSNPIIGRELSLSTKTIANHVTNIFSKLQVADRAEAIIRARDAGLGTR
jgi:DNA-binding NarL/FixJ family response regulator